MSFTYNYGQKTLPSLMFFIIYLQVVADTSQTDSLNLSAISMTSMGSMGGGSMLNNPNMITPPSLAGPHKSPSASGSFQVSVSAPPQQTEKATDITVITEEALAMDKDKAMENDMEKDEDKDTEKDKVKK